MLTVISPAKSLNSKSFDLKSNYTQPAFLEEASQLVNKLKKTSVKKLGEMMKISPKLATQNKERYLNWKAPHSLDSSKPVAFLFRGEVYIGLASENFDHSDFEFAQGSLRILSGLYGALRPLDLVQPYRLPMGTPLKIGRKTNLYHFWGDKVSKFIEKDLETHENKILVNLASEEYYKVLRNKNPSYPVITPVFKEDYGNRQAIIHVYAKRARGMMAKYIIKNKIQDPENMKDFNENGYRFNKELSTDREWYFTRLA